MGLLKKIAKKVTKKVSGVVKDPKKLMAMVANPIMGAANEAAGPNKTASYIANPGWAFQADQMGYFGDKAPPMPGVDQNAKALQKSQREYAQGFRADLPGVKNQMATQLAQDSQSQLQDDLKASRSSASSRGLLYGGIQQGNEGRQRQQAQRGLLGGISASNLGLDESANQMDAAAVQTGVNMQQQQQNMQNMVYQNALAKMNGQNQVAGSMITAGAMAAMMSDERAKHKVGHCPAEIYSMLDELKAMSFLYKEFVNSPGMHYGVMAQDLEKSNAGKSVVFEQDGYKMLDVAKVSGLVLASLANIHQRLKKIEGSNGIS